ncbi:kinase-like domain-containing protein [Gautieria morchelliformis]|nr:kinase-like domain-containing protein [Gautieria morchelliformis]
MSHPLARAIPPIEELTKQHAEYMTRLPESERNDSFALTARLNMAALQRITENAVGGTCTGIDKIYEGLRPHSLAASILPQKCLVTLGGFNQIFNISFQPDTKHVIARINMPFGGGSVVPEDQRRNRVSSEAATLCWVRENTTIPVPEVIAFDENPDNEVGAAYIIEERILGCPLHDVWSDPMLTFEDRKRIVQQLADFQAQLISTSFPMIGSIFINKETKQYDIGPLAPPVQLEPPRLRRGPWKTARDEMKSWIEDHMEELRNDPDAALSSCRDRNAEDVSPSTISAFHALYSGILTLIENVKLIDRCDDSWCPLSLSHPDLTRNNILVDYNDPTRVMALIDWEGANVGPWWQRELDLTFIREEEIQPCSPAEELEWDQLRDAWNDVLKERYPPGLSAFNAKIGWFLSRLTLLVRAGCAAWSSLENTAETIASWRTDWPEPDPAFKQIDEFLTLHGLPPSVEYE